MISFDSFSFSSLWPLLRMSLVILIIPIMLCLIFLTGILAIWLGEKFVGMFINFRYEHWPIHGLRTEKEIEEGKREYLARPESERHLWRKTGRTAEQQLEVLATVWDMDGYRADGESLRDIAAEIQELRKTTDPRKTVRPEIVKYRP